MRGFLRSFGWAAHGIAMAIRQERNMRFHLCATMYVLIFAQFYTLTRAEWLLLIMLIAGVLALELVNSSIERVVDKACPEQNPLAGLAKDMAAGAVLVFSIGAAVCGVWLFWDTAVFAEIGAWFKANPVWFWLLLSSLCTCIVFISAPIRKRK